MAWTEEGYEVQVLAPRRALRLRMADRLEDQAITAPAVLARELRRQAGYLRDSAAAP